MLSSMVATRPQPPALVVRAGGTSTLDKAAPHSWRKKKKRLFFSVLGHRSPTARKKKQNTIEIQFKQQQHREEDKIQKGAGVTCQSESAGARRGSVARTFDPSPWEADGLRSLCEVRASLVYRVYRVGKR